MIQNFSKRSKGLQHSIKQDLPGTKQELGKIYRDECLLTRIMVREDKKLKIDVLKQYF